MQIVVTFFEVMDASESENYCIRILFGFLGPSETYQVTISGVGLRNVHLPNAPGYFYAW